MLKQTGLGSFEIDLHDLELITIALRISMRHAKGEKLERFAVMAGEAEELLEVIDPLYEIKPWSKKTLKMLALHAACKDLKEGEYKAAHKKSDPADTVGWKLGT